MSGSLLYRADALSLTIVVVVCAAASSEIGFRIANGRRRPSNKKPEAKERRALEESQAVQAEVWARAVALAEGDHASESYGLILEAQDEMFDLRARRLGALAARLPDAVVVLLLVTAVLTASVSGYALGLHGERHPMPSGVILILTGVVLYIILDIDRPQRGLLQTRETALLELADRLGAPP